MNLKKNSTKYITSSSEVLT